MAMLFFVVVVFFSSFLFSYLCIAKPLLYRFGLYFVFRTCSNKVKEMVHNRLYLTYVQIIHTNKQSIMTKNKTHKFHVRKRNANRKITPKTILRLLNVWVYARITNLVVWMCDGSMLSHTTSGGMHFRTVNANECRSDEETIWHCTRNRKS